MQSPVYNLKISLLNERRIIKNSFNFKEKDCDREFKFNYLSKRVFKKSELPRFESKIHLK